MNDINFDTLKAIENLRKTMNSNFVALNTNLTDCAKSLRALANAVEQKGEETKKLYGDNTLYTSSEDYWHPVLGPNGSLPGDEYDWVLVRIRDIGVCTKPYNIPHIAEFRRNSGKWWAEEWDNYYGSNEVPFEVVFWRPIPDEPENNKKEVSI